MPSIRFLNSRRVAPQEELRELGNVVGPFPQRRQLDGDDVDAVVEILAELSFLHRFLEVHVGRRDQPEIGLDRLRPTDPLDLAFLDGAQQLRLQVEPQVADFVEEQRAVRRQLELPELLAVRAGKRSALVAEESAFGELARNRRQVDGDERRLRIPGLAVNQPGEQLLARSALSKDEDRRRQLGDLVHEVDDVARNSARADDEVPLRSGLRPGPTASSPAGSGPAARPRCRRATAAGRSRSPW